MEDLFAGLGDFEISEEGQKEVEWFELAAMNWVTWFENELMGLMT